MQKSLFSKYFSICSSIIMVSITVLGMVFMLFASQYFQEDKYKTLLKNASQAAVLTQANYQQNGNGVVDRYTVLPSYLIRGDAVDATLFLVDMNGKTLLCTHQDGAACNHVNYLVPQEAIEQVRTKGIYQETGRLGGIYSKQYFTVGVPVKDEQGLPVGIVFASSSAASLNIFLLEILKMFALSSIAVILLAFVVIYFVTKRMVAPLRQMVKATQSFSKGDFTVRVPVDSYDEIGKLSMAFNNMAGSLATMESVRRSFIANVSHELKTPMTTIGGFIDGILDGTIPEEKRDHYLHIVADEVQRLSRLVRSMLNIAKIEAGEMKLSPAMFDLNDTVCRTIFTFEQKIEEKQLEIRGLDVGKVMLEADADLIHQVVYNLLENAVKFTNIGGYIEVGYQTEGNKLHLSIKNSGAGISKEEISRIFDRFYKSDKSRSLDKNGVGLGLYIVRTIINLHNGDIMVKSVEGQYSEFIVTLPISQTKSSQQLFKKSEKIK